MNNYQVILNLPEPLITYYFDKSRATGKTPELLVLEDIEKYHEYLAYLEREYERNKSGVLIRRYHPYR